jgi:hypothetical protein
MQGLSMLARHRRTRGDPLPDLRALARFRYRLRRFLRFSERSARAVGVKPSGALLVVTPDDRLEGMLAAADILGALQFLGEGRGG